MPSVSSEISNENFDPFEEEDPFHRAVENKRKVGNRKIDMNFVGYSYKAGVEAERTMLVNVLKELDNVSDQQFEPNDARMGSANAHAFLMTDDSDKSIIKQKNADYQNLQSY